ncbi:MAG: hypothetical protein JXM69_00655 [Anaerolineae bacterium]|nr:hypothetical protein [Anaerolineae bacterium]
MVKFKERKTLNLIKAFSLLFVVAAVALTASLSMAAGGGGDTPQAAVALDKEVNRGHLDPLEQHWFKFVADEAGQAIDIEKSLTLIFTPKQPYTIDYVNLNIFEENQIQYFFNGDISNMANLGAGSVVERDSNPDTGELVWTGWIFGPKTYYVQVVNNSDFPIDYHLFNADVKQAELGEPEPPPTPAPPPPAEAAEGEAAPQASDDPVNPSSLSPDGLTKGKLAPNTTGWYEFEFPDFNDKEGLEIQELEFTLFFTPDDGHRRHNVNFELFRKGEVDFWLRGEGKPGMTNFGAGQLVDRDGDYLTGERLWSGAVLKGDKYLLAVTNGNDVEIDYYLFQGDVYNAELGEPTVQVAQVFDPGESPQTSVPLKLGENIGRLQPGEQAWHSFFITDFDNEPFEQMALTMVMTPDDGNRIYYVPFDVFAAGDVQYWSPTDYDNSQITNMGAGSVVFRDDNPETGERFWNGWVIDNSLYLVQVRNGSDVAIDYHLYTGDVYRPELGGPTQPQVEIAAAEPGTERSAPFDLALGVNKGKLAPGEDVWYRFTRADVAATGDDTAFTLVFVPNDGNRVYNVGFDLYSGAEQNRFGSGQVVERDQDVVTGELLWTGQVRPNEVYYMRISNGTDIEIEYWIFPDDVVNASLE